MSPAHTQRRRRHRMLPEPDREKALNQARRMNEGTQRQQTLVQRDTETLRRDQTRSEDQRRRRTETSRDRGELVQQLARQGQQAQAQQRGTGRRILEPVRTKPKDVSVNQNAGSPRFGQKFTTTNVAGGERHTYAGGKSIFVRKHEHPTVGRERASTPDPQGHAPEHARTGQRDRMVRDLAGSAPAPTAQLARTPSSDAGRRKKRNLYLRPLRMPTRQLRS